MRHEESIDATDLIEQLFAAGRQIALAPSIDELVVILGDIVSGEIGIFNNVDNAVIAPVDYCGIFRLDASAGRDLTLGTLAVWDRRVGPRRALSDQYEVTVGAFFDMIHDGDVLVIDDMDDIDNDRRLDDADRSLLRSTGMSSVLCAPLIARNQLLGLLFIGFGARHIYSHTEIRLYQMLADQAALAWLTLIPDRRDEPVGLIEDRVSDVQSSPTTSKETEGPLTLPDGLQRERDLLEATLEATNDAVLMIDTARVVVIANLQFEAFFSVPRYELLNHPVDELVERLRGQPNLPTDLASLILLMLTDTRESAGGDFTIELPNPRIFVWYSAPVHANDGTIFGRLFVFRDATREREVDRMKTEFISLVSHELRTPLTSIKGFTDLTLEGGAGEISREVREYLNIVKHNSDRLGSLINDILDITRIETGHLQIYRKLCDVEKIIKSTLANEHHLIAERHQSLALVIETKLPPVWGDGQRIGQIVSNLVSNASKYTPEQGRIIVEARLIESSAEVPEAPPTPVYIPSILIAVHDTGFGIPPADQPLIFTRFYRTEHAAKEQIAGTGLGLAIAKSFVELHRGQIWFSSVLGRGSSFFFTLPLIEAS